MNKTKYYYQYIATRNIMNNVGEFFYEIISVFSFAGV